MSQITDDFGIQSVPPRYDEHSSYYVHNSQGYSRAVEEIEAEERDMADTEQIVEAERLENQRLLEEIAQATREEDKKILEEIHRFEEQREMSRDLGEYEDEKLDEPGTNLDLLA